MSGRTFRTPSGRSVTLGRVLGQGGEGEVRVVTGGQEVAKLYWPGKRSADLQRKIDLMVSHPPRDPMRKHGCLSLAWPTVVLHDGTGAFAGFLMPRLDTRRCRPLHQVYRASGYPVGIDWAMLVRTARNLASVVAAVHGEGYVIGDLNESNVLAATDTVVTLVDCDSMQVPDPRRRTVYRCDVGKPEYTPPELHGRDFSRFDRAPSADLFALAALICQLLIRGRHPFSGHPGPAITDNIRAGETFFVNGFASAPGEMPPPDFLPPAIHRLFERALVDGRRNPDLRPGASEWKRALDGLLGQMAACPRNASHKYSQHLSNCPWCVFETKTGRPAFPRKGRGRKRPTPSMPPPLSRPPRSAAAGRARNRPKAPASTWTWSPTAPATLSTPLRHQVGARLLAWSVRKLRNAAVGCILLCLCGVLLVFALPLLFDAPGTSPAMVGGRARPPAGVATSPPPGGAAELEAPTIDPFQEIGRRRTRAEAWSSLGTALDERGQADLAAGARGLASLLSTDLPPGVEWKSRIEVLSVLDRAGMEDDEWIGDEGDRARNEERNESAQALYQLAHLLDPDDREWLGKIEPRKGQRVARGIDWKAAYEDQDGGEGTEGVIVAVPPETRPGWVMVEWPGQDEANWYRWGEEQGFDLSLAR